MNKRTAILFLMLLTGYGGLSSCSNGGSQSTNSNFTTTSGYSFNYSGQLFVTKGSIQQLYLTLNQPLTSNSVTVAIDSSNPELAKVTPGKCYLSNTNPYCPVTIYGLKNGNVSLVTLADGKISSSLDAVVTNSPVYGFLGVESSITSNPSSMESGANLTVSFSSYQAVNGNYTINVRGGLLFSSQITDASQAYFNVTPNPPINGSASQCQVTTQQPICSLTFTVPENAINQALTLNANIVGAITSSHSYGTSLITAIPESTPMPGTIQLTTQTSSSANPDNASIPLGMNAPLFVNWNNVAMNGTVNITLNSSNPSIVSFYSYSPGNNINIQTSASTSCTLTYPNALSCGLGIRALSSGSATISATANANNGQSYPINNLVLTVKPQDPAIRTITFTNSSTNNIFIGITTGGANAYISPTMPAVIPGTPTANTQPGGGSLCGPSNPLAACPIGSTCLQGGESPNVTSPYYCYYDSPIPVCGNNCSNNYQISPNGSATINISASSGENDPSGIIWSGNFFARTNCNPVTGICENATCNGKNGGLQCGPGTGGSPGVNTLAEATFQRGHVDYYDVSIINGINFAAAFGPSTIQPSVTNAFICGTAGSSQPQSGGWSQTNQNNAGLPPALWSSLPNESSFPIGVSVSAESATSFYRWVEYSASALSCSKDSDCSAPEKCGYWIGTAFNQLSGSTTINNSSASYIKHCGSHIAWITVDSIFGLNQSGTNLNNLPFNLTQSTTNPVTGGLFSVGDLQLCIDNAFSSYAGQPTPVTTAGNPILACGGVSWNLESGGYITRVSQPVITVGPTWMSNVLPTITWLKMTCPTCYTYPFDDMSSTFTCGISKNYNVTFSNMLQ